MSAEPAPPRLFERVRLLTIQPPNYPHSAAFGELVDGMAGAFTTLGSRVDAAVNQALLGDGINLVFGAHLIAPNLALPPNSLIVNLEQMHHGHFAQPSYVELLKRHPVLDYSARNVARIRALTGNPHVFRFGVGYDPALTRIPVAAQQDIDILFYGVVNERRGRILDALQAAGLAVGTVPLGIYGAERDAWIARSKLVLNVHFYDDKIHELVRTSYLLSNRKCVVSECDTQTEIDDDVRDALVAVPYEGIVEACRELVRDDARRRAQEHRGFEIFARRDQAEILAALIPELSKPLPRLINLGSGKAFDPERLNIDIDAKWQPDICGDLAAPAGLRQIFFSKRFGLSRLEPGQFDEIVAMDVLEHVPDLSALMTRCLQLLRTGGSMRIGVPYDLSWGAWQDPTHVRAFNERSWLYYTDWHWYLGWIEARFDVGELKMVFSPVGETLRQHGVASEEIFRTPRAVDSMQVVLIKRATTEQERQQARAWHSGATQVQA